MCFLVAFGGCCGRVEVILHFKLNPPLRGLLARDVPAILHHCCSAPIDLWHYVALLCLYTQTILCRVGPLV